MHSEGFRGVRRYWLCRPRAVAATPADSRRRALREVDKSQWTIPKVQACKQFIQAQAYSLEPDDPPESPALPVDRLSVVPTCISYREHAAVSTAVTVTAKGGVPYGVLPAFSFATKASPKASEEKGCWPLTSSRSSTTLTPQARILSTWAPACARASAA